jgi:hypothetical protein
MEACPMATKDRGTSESGEQQTTDEQQTTGRSNVRPTGERITPSAESGIKPEDVPPGGIARKGSTEKDKIFRFLADLINKGK